MNADGTVKNKKRFALMREAAEFFKKIMRADCERIAVENPAPMKIAGLPPYSQIIEPYFFGDPWKKRTCLWLKNLPALEATDIVKPLACWVEEAGRNVRTKLKTPGIRGVRDPKERSKTFPGIARAMAEQWGTDRGTYQITIDLESEEHDDDQ